MKAELQESHEKASFDLMDVGSGEFAITTGEVAVNVQFKSLQSADNS
jgi:hypothetical protein